MVWDLRAALLKKEEVETSRLLDFEFRQRARTFSLMASSLKVAHDKTMHQIALGDDQSVLEWLRVQTEFNAESIRSLYNQCRAAARQQLIDELGDPAPHPLG